jgi:hypothetical protein
MLVINVSAILIPSSFVRIGPGLAFAAIRQHAMHSSVLTDIWESLLQFE